MDSIKEVYEKYKHLDGMLSNEKWLESYHLPNKVLHELWMAIKEDVILRDSIGRKVKERS